MAIASLVLSLVWLSGLGSLLAVIFAIVARRNIRESRGSQTGDGLAIAGLVIGILGLLGAVLFIVTIAAVSHDANQSATPTIVSMGTRVAGGDSDIGITTVAVESLAYPVVPNPTDISPDSGKEYAVAKVEVCAGSSGAQSGPTDFEFTLGFADQETADSSLPIKAPDLGQIGGLGANACATGYVSFEIATGTTPSFVAYQPGLIHQYRWKTSG
jgi:hypothetical protein